MAPYDEDKLNPIEEPSSYKKKLLKMIGLSKWLNIK